MILVSKKFDVFLSHISGYMNDFQCDFSLKIRKRERESNVISYSLSSVDRFEKGEREIEKQNSCTSNWCSGKRKMPLECHLKFLT